jgi:hypothetical protein
MIDVTDDRADAADKAIDWWALFDGREYQRNEAEAATLITDLLHLAKRSGWDIERMLTVAKEQFEEQSK